jgi:large subunit ribosomal protein L32
MRRSHDALSAPTISASDNGTMHLRHHIDSNGMYRGKKVIKTKDE